MDTQVTVIGAGPVGLTLAMDLALRGIEVTVVERRAEDEPADAKCNTVAARTMEVFRRLGVADQVRAAGLADDFPTDAIYCTALSGHELSRIRMPSRNERFAADGRSAPGFLDSDWPTPEPVVRVSQLYLNPILYDHARAFERIKLLPETAFVRYEDHGDGATVHCENRAGEPSSIRSRYVIGCDGSSSPTRKQMGISLVGDAAIGRTRSSLVRCPAIKDLFPGKPAWMSWVVNPRAGGTVVAIDGEELWLIHRSHAIDPDRSIRDVLGAGDDLTWEVIHHQDWTARRLVAERFRAGNVFICGDAAHIWIPFAGYGMNAGIADCTNLSWMMAAVLNRQAGERMLDAHERERHPITEQVSQLAMGKAMQYARMAQRQGIPKTLESGGSVGETVRKRLGRQLYDINWPQFACAGLNFGYYYDDSPIIHYDGADAPSYDMGTATPSTAPGCRLPHFWMGGRQSVYDLLGPNYTLLNFSRKPVAEHVARAFDSVNMPLRTVDVPELPEHYAHAYVLARTDQHVAWRGDAFPTTMAPFVAHLAGRASACAH